MKAFELRAVFVQAVLGREVKDAEASYEALDPSEKAGWEAVQQALKPDTPKPALK